MAMVNTQRPALEEVIPADDIQSTQFVQDSTYELRKEDGSVQPLYFLGLSEPWDGTYCDRSITIAGFGFEPPAEGKEPPSDVFCYAAIMRPPRDGSEKQYGECTVVVEGLRFVGSYMGTFTFELNGNKTTYCRLV